MACSQKVTSKDTDNPGPKSVYHQQKQLLSNHHQDRDYQSQQERIIILSKNNHCLCKKCI